MYANRGGVAAYHIVWIGLCLRSVPGVRVLASAVDDSTSKKTHTRVVPQAHRSKQYGMLPHHHA